MRCSGTWIRTMIDGFKGRCPTIRRSPNKNVFNLNEKRPASQIFEYLRTAKELAIAAAAAKARNSIPKISQKLLIK